MKRVGRLRRRLRGRVSGDAGFGLIEAVIALVIAGAVFSSVSVAALQTVRSSISARLGQQAADLLTKQIEYVRSLDFYQATEVTSDLAGESPLGDLTGPAGGPYTLKVNGEQVVAGSVGLLPQHMQIVSSQGTDFTIKTYITAVTDTVRAGAAARRVTVKVSWLQNGQAHSRTLSSLYSYFRRGLPLPRFTFGAPSSYTTNTGAALALVGRLTNVGAPDAFNLSATAPALGGTWTWYSDSNGNGVYDAGTDAALTDSDGDGQPDTGVLQVAQAVTVFAVRTVGAAEPTPQSVALTAVSAAQPAASTGTVSFTHTVAVSSVVCACVLTDYYLHNGGSGDTATAASLPMDKNAVDPSRTGLFNYSTDCTSAVAADCTLVPTGRYLQAGGSANEKTQTKVAPWYYAVPVATTLQGTASVTVYVRTTDGTGLPTTVTASVGTDANNSITGGGYTEWARGIATAPPQATPGFTAVTVNVPLIAQSVASGKYLVVRVLVTSGLSNARLAYDTTLYPAKVVLPITTGG